MRSLLVFGSIAIVLAVCGCQKKESEESERFTLLVQVRDGGMVIGGTNLPYLCRSTAEKGPPVRMWFSDSTGKVLAEMVVGLSQLPGLKTEMTISVKSQDRIMVLIDDALTKKAALFLDGDAMAPETLRHLYLSAGKHEIKVTGKLSPPLSPMETDSLPTASSQPNAD